MPPDWRSTAMIASRSISSIVIPGRIAIMPASSGSGPSPVGEATSAPVASIASTASVMSISIASSMSSPAPLGEEAGGS